jgi:hypothetical protein
LDECSVRMGRALGSEELRVAEEDPETGGIRWARRGPHDYGTRKQGLPGLCGPGEFKVHRPSADIALRKKGFGETLPGHLHSRCRRRALMAPSSADLYIKGQ